MIRDRYEFMVYRQLRDGLESRYLHCHDSSRFRSFDDVLVDDETFDRRDEPFPRPGLENAARPLREQLDELRDLVEERFDSVNRRILAGENRFVRVQDGKTVWERAVRCDVFELRYQPTIDPDRDRWELCSRVLSRRDVVERLPVPWLSVGAGGFHCV